jgi:hypothetical protein
VYQNVSCGAITYSDGVNDDWNKVLRSALLWNPKEDVHTLLVDYGCYYLGEPYGEQVAERLLSLEKNWYAPLLGNAGVKRTYTLWIMMEREAPQRLKKNWRFQMALLRACYDEYVQEKLEADTKKEQLIYQTLLSSLDSPMVAVTKALDQLSFSHEDAWASLRTKLLALGQALYDSIGMQLSISRWGGIWG